MRAASLLLFLTIGIIIGATNSGQEFLYDAHGTLATASPAAPSKYYYYPGQEVLGPDEMRLTALGTGVPNVQKSQASSCWLLELGNGEKFLFDLGTGCTANLASLNVSWEHFDKIFLSHLHSDHFGDLGALYVAGNLMGRSTPLKIWGPSGDSPAFGTKVAVEHVIASYAWDKRSRQGRIPVMGMETEVVEFDHTKAQTVYDKDGVLVRAWPAIHAIDGPVSFSLEWNGLKFVFSGDTSPNKWFLDNARNADILVYDCFTSVESLIYDRRYTPTAAWVVGTQVHTAPQSAGKLFTLLEPRMAVCYHFINNSRTLPKQLESVRMTYAGPLTMAEDLYVWNVTPEAINLRKAIGVDYAFGAATAKKPADRSLRVELSDWLWAGRLPMPDIDTVILEQLDTDKRQKIRQTIPSELLPAVK